MAIKLEKGGASHNITIAKLQVGLGWDPIISNVNETFDLDVSAFMLGASKKIISDDYLVYYNSEKRVRPDNLLRLENKNSTLYPPYLDEDGKEITSEEHWRRKTRPVDPDFSVYGSIDDMEGVESDGGDDETMNIDLRKINPLISEIVIAVSIYDFQKWNQTFGKVNDAYVRILNEATGEEMFRYDLQGDFAINTSAEFCSIYRDAGLWKVKALGFGHDNGLQSLLDIYN